MSSSHHVSHRLVFLVWSLVVVLGALSGALVFDRLDSSLDPAASSEAESTEARLISLEGVEGSIGAIVRPGLDGAGAAAAARDAATKLGKLDGIVGVGGGPETPGFTSVDGESYLVVAAVEPGLSGDETEALIESARSVFGELEPAIAELGGSAVLDQELGDSAEADLLRADAVAVPIVILLTGLALGRLRASAFPLAIVLVAVTGPLAILLGLSLLTDVSVFAINVVSMFGIGLAVDYGLLIGSRYREERARHEDPRAAVAVTMATAGRAVTFSGITVAVALSGLLVFREPLLRSLAYGGIGAVLVAVLAARTLLPAFLRRFPSIIPPAPESPSDGILYRLSRFIQRRPGLVLVGVIAVLVVAALPTLDMKFEGLDARSLPIESESRGFADSMADEFPAIPLAPIEVVVDAAGDDRRLIEFSAGIAGLSGVQSVAAEPLSSGVTKLTVAVDGPPTGSTALDAVREIRLLPTAVVRGVTGEAAEEVDLLESVSQRLPAALALIGLITLALLMVFTRAPIAALKALVVNLLSVGAAFGALVWIFQYGNLASLLGFQPIGALEAIILLLTFVFAFGLSMDYEVFLLARIREEYDASGDNAAAVAVGLQRSGKVVTQAAFLIVVLFVGFAAGDLILIKQLGVGLALAVLVDATVVRALLVPAIMVMMGDRNWWAPAFMRPRS